MNYPPENLEGGVPGMLLREQAALRQTLSELLAEERRLFEAHAAHQARMVAEVLQAHLETMQVVHRLGDRGDGAVGGGGQQASSLESAIEGIENALRDQLAEDPLAKDPHVIVPNSTIATREVRSPRSANAVSPRNANAARQVVCDPGLKSSEVQAPKLDGEEPAKEEEKAEDAFASMADVLQSATRAQEVLSTWKNSHGMHTVEKWVRNYKKHPGGWGALLMIHGIPEITGRLRSKVDNAAIYSALFLSLSIPLAVESPAGIMEADHVLWSLEYWLHEARKRVFLYALLISIGLHFLSISLALSFNSVLNQAARDSDVFRLFSKGQGFIATVKCQSAFSNGCVALFVCLAIAITDFLPAWEVAILGLALGVYVGMVFKRTSKLLFENGSIMNYWRQMGRQQHDAAQEADDPYELDVPLYCFESRTEANNLLFQKDGLLKAELGSGKHTLRDVPAKKKPRGPKDPADKDNNLAKNVAVAGIF